MLALGVIMEIGVQTPAVGVKALPGRGRLKLFDLVHLVLSAPNFQLSNTQGSHSRGLGQGVANNRTVDRPRGGVVAAGFGN